MNKLSALLVAATLAVPLSQPASASTTPEWHTCGGHIDFTCNDGGGNFCTLWLNFRCTLGIA